MIRAHLPSSTSWPIDFFTEGPGDYQLVVETDVRRIAVWKRTSQSMGSYNESAYREVDKVTEDNLYMLPPFFQGYVRKWWEKWGL